MRWQQQAWCDAGRLPILSGRTGGMETVRNPASARFDVEHRAVSAFRLSVPECQGTGSRTAQFLELLPMGNSQMNRAERRRESEHLTAASVRPLPFGALHSRLARSATPVWRDQQQFRRLYGRGDP